MNLMSAVLGVCIGLIFVYLLLSLMCSVLQEFVANLLSWRGKHLKKSIQSMLNDPAMRGLAKRLYNHPRIKSLSFAGELPSYLPSETFAKALADIIVEDGNLNAVVSGPLAPFINDAAGQVDKLEADLAQWFDAAMDRLSGWYKRNVQIWLFVYGVAFAVLFNVSTLEIARVLWAQPGLRDSVAQSAQDFYDRNKPTNGSSSTNATTLTAEQIQGSLENLELPIGWSYAVRCRLFEASCKAQPPRDGWTWATFVGGWLITALAVSLGTSFWFTALGDALQLRAAGAKPEKSAAAKSS